MPTLSAALLPPHARLSAAASCSLSDEAIEEQLSAQRARLEAEAAREAAKETPTETHAVAARKAAEMDGLRAAFGLKEAPREGDAFDRELQERKKQERLQERERVAKERERAKRVRARACVALCATGGAAVLTLPACAAR